jgi:hypothetical protein
VIVGAVVLLLLAAAVFLTLPPGASSAVVGAADDARGWNGTTYRGPVRGPDGRTVTVAVTVGVNGDKAGTFTSAGGGRAEFAETGGTQLLRGNAAWWASSEKGRRLAGIWLRDPTPETTWLAPLPLLAPGALADDLSGAATGSTPDYADAGDQRVGDRDGRVVAAPERRVVLSDDREADLLAIVPPESAGPAGLRVAPAAPAELSAVGSAGSRLAGARGYESVLYFPDGVRVEIIPAASCTTPTCTVSVRLTNTSGLEGRGIVTIRKNGTTLSRTPFRLAGRAGQTVSASSPNSGLAAGRNVTVDYEARITGS